jgi:hypothetical protein
MNQEGEAFHQQTRGFTNNSLGLIYSKGSFTTDKNWKVIFIGFIMGFTTSI